MCFLAYAVYVHLEDITVSHVKKLADVLILMSRNIAELVILEVECDCIRIMFVILVSHHLHFSPDF